MIVLYIDHCKRPDSGVFDVCNVERKRAVALRGILFRRTATLSGRATSSAFWEHLFEGFDQRMALSFCVCLSSCLKLLKRGVGTLSRRGEAQYVVEFRSIQGGLERV